MSWASARSFSGKCVQLGTTNITGEGILPEPAFRFTFFVLYLPFALAEWSQVLMLQEYLDRTWLD